MLTVLDLLGSPVALLIATAGSARFCQMITISLQRTSERQPRQTHHLVPSFPRFRIFQTSRDWGELGPSSSSPQLFIHVHRYMSQTNSMMMFYPSAVRSIWLLLRRSLDFLHLFVWEHVVAFS